MEASSEEDDPKDLTTKTEASAEEAEETTRPSERLRWQRRRISGWGPVLLMLQTTQIELESKDCIFLVKSLGIQSTSKLFSMVSIPNKVR